MDLRFENKTMQTSLILASVACLSNSDTQVTKPEAVLLLGLFLG